MKISYNWLKNYIDLSASPEETAVLLTGCGLEVESIEKFQSLKGGLDGLVIGEVKEKAKHPDADRLSVTKVDVGGPELLNIVCGAPNVEAGQKVVIATVGATLYPLEGEPFQIKKSKIRGAASEGMICAEDEIGMGKSHDGIIVLDATAKTGTPAKEYFGIEDDYILEIGLTPNRSDAASHMGVARDLAAVLNSLIISSFEKIVLEYYRRTIDSKLNDTYLINEIDFLFNINPNNEIYNDSLIDSLEVLCHKGSFYFQLNEYEKANEFYKKVIDLKPNYAPAYIQMGKVYYQQNRFNKAIDYYQKAITIELNDSNLLSIPRLDYFFTKDYEKAIEYYQKALKIQYEYTNPNSTSFEDLLKKIDRETDDNQWNTDNNFKHVGHRKHELRLPTVLFSVDDESLEIEVIVEDAEACPRYSGLTISGIEVKESPAWLQTRLKSIGLKPINNVVDATNFILHELGQPLHAFDADKVTGKKVVVKKQAEGTPFVTLDGTERKLSANDLMICNAEEGMCIAGVFGGQKSGITSETKNIFLESAYFNPVSIRKTSRLHGLKTDASFRFERGADPNITVYALKRAALLIKEIAGGKISSDVVDVYPEAVKNFSVEFSFANADRLIGKALPKETIKNIITDLKIEIEKESDEGLLLSVPPFKADVTREIDVIEEVLRVYGYNAVEIPSALRSSISYATKPDPEKVRNAIADLLSSKGLTEIMCNSLTAEKFTELLDEEEKTKTVRILNPLSSDLNVMRQSLLFGGLESLAYNINRKNPDLKCYEFGKTYHLEASGNWSYTEKSRLSILVTGRKQKENWNSTADNAGYFYLKGLVESVLKKLGLAAKEITGSEVSQCLSYSSTYESGKKQLVVLGEVNKAVLKKTGIDQEVFYADFDWDELLVQLKKAAIQYREVPVYPSVRRDLALLVDKQVRYADIKELAFKTEKHLLKEVNLFDVYEGKNLEPGKKSYAVSFILQDERATLNDNAINKVMDKVASTLKENLGATIR